MDEFYLAIVLAFLWRADEAAGSSIYRLKFLANYFFAETQKIVSGDELFARLFEARSRWLNKQHITKNFS